MTTVDRHRDVIRTSAERGVVLAVAPAPGLDAAFDGHDVERCTQLKPRVRAAVEQQRPFVGIVGSDSALRAAAEVLAGSSTALLPVPAAGRSQFAATFGIDTVDDAVRAAKGGTIRAVDLGRVNDRVFLNSARVGDSPGSITDALRTIADGRRIRVAIDGRLRRAWFVFVGNDCYGENTDDPRSRDTVDEHVLDVRIARADQRLAALGLLRGRHDIERRTCTSITIGVRRRTHVDVVLDGERVTTPAPLRFSSEPNALNVLMP